VPRAIVRIGKVFDPVDDVSTLAGHRRHQAVVKVASVFSLLTSGGLGQRLLDAEVGGEELPLISKGRCSPQTPTSERPGASGWWGTGSAATGGRTQAERSSSP